MYKHSINPKYIKQLGTFRYNFRRGKLNNEGVELHEVKRSWDKTEIGKEIMRERVNKYLLKSLAQEIVLRHEK